MACKICRITILDFVFGEQTEGGYDKWDLENGIKWCEEMIEEGFTVDPMDKFNLENYIGWAKNKLETLK